jgi:hypothetical protein
MFGPMGNAFSTVVKGITSNAGAAALAVGGIGLAATGVITELYKVGEEWHNITKSIITNTTDTDTQVKGLIEDIKSTAQDTAAPIEDIADVATRLHRAFGLTGQPLEQLTHQISDLNELTGEKLNIPDLVKTMRGFGIEVTDTSKTLDQFYDMHKQSGKSVNDLLASIATAGPQFRGLGMDIGEAANFLTTMRKAGIDGDAAIKGLRVAISNLSKEEGPKGSLLDKFLKGEGGKDVNQRFGDIITQLHNMYNEAENTNNKTLELAANDLARSAFGRSWTQIADAIHRNKLEADALDTSVKNTGASIEKDRERTHTWHEDFQKLKNEISTELQPAADITFKAISNMIDQYLIRPFREFNDLIKDFQGIRPPEGPSGPATLDPFGNVIPTDQAPAGPNPLGVMTGNGGGGIPTGPGGGPNALGIGGGAAGVRGPNVPRGGNAGPMGYAPLGPNIGGGASGVGLQNVPSPAAMAAIAKAQALNGLPYSNSPVPGVGLGGAAARTDCSGYVSDVYSAMVGHNVSFTTTANFEALGFHKGYMPGALNIGVLPLAGQSGHMAATLPNGVNIESGGSSGGVSYDSGPGAMGKQFPEHYWFMPGYETGGPARGGAGMKDDVPSLLTRGEHVLTVEDVDALGGHSAVYALRSALHRDAGGPADWSLAAIAGSGDKGKGKWKPEGTPGEGGGWHTGTGGWFGGPHTKMQFPGGHTLSPGLPHTFMGPDWDTILGKNNYGHYQFGGPVGVGNPLDPNDPGSQMAGAMLGGMQQQGGWVGLGASFAQMGIDIARQHQQQQQGGAPPPGGGVPMPDSAAPTGRAPGQGLPGTGQQSGGGGGGVIGAAAGMFPGGGVMAQLATRTAKFGGQLMAIGGQGLMETFLPNGSPLGDPGASWLGRGLQGISQVRAAGPNTAGSQAPIQQQETHVGQGGQPGPGGPASQPGQAPLIGEMHVTSPSDSQQIARDIDRQIRAYGAGGGR